jgi:eukaryotic-like serine/threonine-protein kinase
MDPDELTKTIPVDLTQSPDAIPPNPEFIGPYKIESLLKKGGMSLIYLAVNPTTSQPVVVKVVLPKYLKNKDILIRLLREAKILGLASHKNIVKLYDLGRCKQGLFVAMEYIQGISLRQFIKSESLTHKRALGIVLEIAYALAHLHSQGIIHRDLKPDNILITESGEIKMIDFGISEFVETEERFHKTQKQAGLGTPHYMSPEQRDHPEKISYGTDIFSLGIIAYELYLGRQAHGIIQTAILPRGLRKIIEKALQIDPDKRYADIIDFIADLTDYLEYIDRDEKRAAPEELYSLLEDTKTRILSKKIPKWANIEIGIALKENAEGGSYLDFFPLIPNRYGVLLAKPTEKSVDALFLSSMLKGMLRMAAVSSPSQPAPYFLDLLNRALCNEKTHAFDFSLLFLDLEHGLLAFASSQPRVLYHVPESLEPRFLDTENPLLGKKPDAAFLEIKETWNPGDLLMLSSFSMESSKIPQLASQLTLDPKILANQALETLIKESHESILIALKRL